MSMNDVTSRDIMRATGITNVATLVRWHGQEGLIPPPEIRTHPEGRGKMAYWPEWVLHRCVRIKQLRKEGMSLAEIRQFLGCDWETASQNYGRKYRFAEASRRIDQNAALANLREVIEHFVLQWMKSQRTAILKTTVQTIAADTIEKAITMLEQGINPVFVLTSDTAVLTAVLTADFAVGLHLSQCRSIEESFMVIPVWKELSAYLNKVAVVPEKPVVYPVSRVVRRTNLSCEEAEVVVMDSLEFEVQPPQGRAGRAKKSEAGGKTRR